MPRVKIILYSGSEEAMRCSECWTEPKWSLISYIMHEVFRPHCYSKSSTRWEETLTIRCRFYKCVATESLWSWIRIDQNCIIHDVWLSWWFLYWESALFFFSFDTGYNHISKLVTITLILTYFIMKSSGFSCIFSSYLIA